MTQVVLPFNMAGSIVFLGTKYKQPHYVGSILVIYGVLVNLMPFFTGTQSASANNPYYNPSIFWIMINTVATVFAAASNIYKEVALKDFDLDVWYTNAWVGVYQLLSGLLTCWTLSVTGFSDPTVGLTDYGTYFYQAIRCFFGLTATDVTNGVTLTCTSLVMIVFSIFIMFNITYNMLMLYIFKSGSSVLFVISSAVALPLSDFLYISSFIAGSAAEPFTLYDGFALFILVLAMYVYYSEPEVRVVVEPNTNKTTLVPATPMFPAPMDERAHQHRHQQIHHHHSTSEVQYAGDGSNNIRAPLLRKNHKGELSMA